MGRYSLVVVNKIDNLGHIINVYDLEEKKEKDKVNIKDIDVFTNKYDNNEQMLEDLYKKGIINFYQGRSYIVSRYKEKNIHFKTIFNSKDVLEIASSVNSGFICNFNTSFYSNMVHELFENLENKVFFDELEQTIYISFSVKSMIVQYRNILLKEKYHEEDLEEERRLKLQILEELKRYKTFRGMYLFFKEYKFCSYKYRKIRDEEKVKYIPKEATYKEKEKGFRDVDLYNQEHEEFLSEEEYNDAFGQEDKSDLQFTYKRSTK